MLTCKYSLIIPVYQVEDYIVECLESIYCQIPEDVQVILVDDGSTDGSGAICDEYAARYAHTEVIHQKNQGVAAARNAGVNAAKGEYLLWVDPDDWVSPQWFKEIDHFIRKNHPDILVFDYAEYEKGLERNVAYGRPAGRIDKEVFLADVVRDVRINNSLWNKVMRKELFTGVQFDPMLRCLEDYAILHDLILKAEKIDYMPAVLYVYRLRMTGLVRTLNLDIAFGSYMVARKRKKHIEQTGRVCSAAGCVKQAQSFCRNFYIAGCPVAYRQFYRECRQYIIDNLCEIFTDQEWSIKEKIKLLMVISTVIGRIYAQMKHAQQKG